MNNRTSRTGLAILGAVSLTTTAATAQPAMAIRFANGQSEITVAPGSQVQVRVWATGMPAIGTSIPWTTPPGTGQVGSYEGFLSVLFDLRASSGSWSGGQVAPGHGLWLNPGFPSGSNLNGLGVGVGFNPPVPHQEFDLFFATLTVGSADIQLSTLIRPTGAPPQTGFEVALSGIMPPLNVGHWLTTLNGTAVIHVPAPATIAMLTVGSAWVARRRR